IRSATPLPRTCSNAAPTCGPFRNCWATPALQLHRNTRTSPLSTSARNTRRLIPGQRKNPGQTGDFSFATEFRVYLSFVFIEEETTMYAVIRSGGKQHRVSPGQTIRLEKVAGEVGAKVELGNVLLVENEGNVQIGSPLVANVKIEAT